MKPMTGACLAQAQMALGAEPLFVIKIDWRTTGTLWYADKDLPAINNAQGRILSLAPITMQQKRDNIGMVGAFAVELDDTDQTFKAIFDANVVERTPISVYQYFEGTGVSDLCLLFKGQIIGHMEYRTGQLSVKFEIESEIQQLPVGFSLDPDVFIANQPKIPKLDPDSIGQVWPLCFGSALHVPALKLEAMAKTVLNQDFLGNDNTNGLSFQVADSSWFPTTGQSIDLIVGGYVFRGHFVTPNPASPTLNPFANTFLVSEANVAKYTSLPLASRPATVLNGLGNPIPNPDLANPFVGWLTTPISIVNNWIWFHDELGNDQYFRVIRQEGTKFWVSSPPGVYSGITLLQLPYVISEVAKNGRAGWFIGMGFQDAVTTSDYITMNPFNSGLANANASGNLPTMAIQAVSWNLPAGTEVKLWANPGGTNDHSEKFVANLIPSTRVAAVFAWQTNPLNGVRTFAPLPQTYYSVNLNDDYTDLQAFDPLGNPIALHPTTIKLINPLNEFEGQGYEDRIYVSLHSTVGPNVVDVLTYLLNTYSTFTYDATTFSAVHGLVANYPVGFALFDQPGLVTLLENIAWQARIGLIQEGGVWFAAYVSKQPTSVYSVAESIVENRTLNNSFTSTEDLTTSFRAKFRYDYSGQRFHDKTLITNTNISTYGFRKKDFNFFIYNVPTLVQKSAKFWSYRLANSWRLARLNVLLRDAIRLELFDCVNINFADPLLVVGAPIISIVEAHAYQTNDDDNSISLQLWIPSRAGTTTLDPKAFLDDSGDVLPADPLDSLQGTPIRVEGANAQSGRVSQPQRESHLAKIVRLNDDAQAVGSYVVNIFDKGYENLPNADDAGNPIELVAWPSNPNLAVNQDTGEFGPVMPLDPGTAVTIVFTPYKNGWVFDSPADSGHSPAKISATDPAVDIYSEGFDVAATQLGVPCTVIPSGATIAVGQQVSVIKRGETVYAIVGGGSGGLNLYVILTNFHNGSYLAQQYDSPGGTAIGSPVTIYELNAASGVPEATNVFGEALADGKVYFDMDIGC